MQADKNVIVVKEADKDQLLLTRSKQTVTPQQLHGDSSAFDSDKHESYIKELNTAITKNQITLTERELNLVKGIQTQHLK